MQTPPKRLRPLSARITTRRYLALALLAAPWACGAGEEQAASVPDTWYDNSHDVVVDVLNDTAVWLDSFFADPRAEVDREAQTFVRVIFDGFLSGVEDESEFDVRFKGKLVLPRLQNKVNIVFSSDADADITGESQVGEDDLGSSSRRDTNSGLGLAYLFRDTPTRKFAVSGGVKGGFSPDVYVNARYRYLYPLTTTTATRLTPTVYWKSDDGFGASMLVDLDHTPDPDTLWRLSLFGDYGEETDGLEWNTQASWRHRLDSKKAISVWAGVKGETEPRELLTEGWLRFRYRRNFYRPWLYYEFEPGLSWHEKEDYDTEPTLSLRLEVQFYK